MRAFETFLGHSVDPPFSSNADYNVLFAEHPRNGTPAHAQFRAFEDTWRWDTEAADNFRQAVEHRFIKFGTIMR